jgi:hypothetical protein
LLKDLINLITKKLVVEVVELKGNRRGGKITKATALISYTSGKAIWKSRVLQ